MLIMKPYAYTLNKDGKVNMIVCEREIETPVYDIKQCCKCSMMCYDRKYCAIRDEKQGFRR